MVINGDVSLINLLYLVIIVGLIFAAVRFFFYR